MALLAMAPRQSLEDAWRSIEPAPAYTHVRQPEVGSALVRARAGGTGSRFNLGELTITRCSVRVQGVVGRFLVGHAYVTGRDRRKAELCAIFDALCQDDARRAMLETALLTPLAEAKRERDLRSAEQAAGTKVDFYTMVRGD